MKQLVAEAAITLTLTLISFTGGVWLVRKAKDIKGAHLVIFWFAFCFGCAGGGLLEMTMGGGDNLVENIRGICEIISIVILFVYAMWATALKVIPDDKSLRIFKRDSILVWKIWIIPFVLQVVLGLLK